MLDDRGAAVCHVANIFLLHQHPSEIRCFDMWIAATGCLSNGPDVRSANAGPLPQPAKTIATTVSIQQRQRCAGGIDARD